VVQEFSLDGERFPEIRDQVSFNHQFPSSTDSSQCDQLGGRDKREQEAPDLIRDRFEDVVGDNCQLHGKDHIVFIYTPDVIIVFLFARRLFLFVLPVVCLMVPD
jgi:hypothetical protein